MSKPQLHGADGAAAPDARQTYLDEARRVIDAAEAAGVAIRVTGGVAIGMICSSSGLEPLRRAYADIDFVGRGDARTDVAELFLRLGYQPEAHFNAVHGATRMFFQNAQLGLQADVFIDGIRACHYLDVRDRLAVFPRTLAPADLLLSKLQIVSTNEKDYQDAIALLADHELTDDDTGLSLPQVVKVCSHDWGWWRTVTMVAARTVEVAERWTEETPSIGHVPERLRTIMETIDSAPKTRKWKLRAKVGDHARWHEDPEELAHDT